MTSPLRGRGGPAAAEAPSGSPTGDEDDGAVVTGILIEKSASTSVAVAAEAEAEAEAAT